MNPATRYEIHPSVAVARVGNSTDSFYLAPEEIGGLPLECDAAGNGLLDAQGAPARVRTFKDDTGRMRRQAARFKILAFDDESPGGREITLNDPAIASISWTVHLANKKAIWYESDELVGNRMLGVEVD